MSRGGRRRGVLGAAAGLGSTNGLTEDDLMIAACVEVRQARRLGIAGRAIEAPGARVDVSRRGFDIELPAAAALDATFRELDESLADAEPLRVRSNRDPVEVIAVLGKRH